MATGYRDWRSAIRTSVRILRRIEVKPDNIATGSIAPFPRRKNWDHRKALINGVDRLLRLLLIQMRQNTIGLPPLLNVQPARAVGFTLTLIGLMLLAGSILQSLNRGKRNNPIQSGNRPLMTDDLYFKIVDPELHPHGAPPSRRSPHRGQSREHQQRWPMKIHPPHEENKGSDHNRAQQR